MVYGDLLLIFGQSTSNSCFLSSELPKRRVILLNIVMVEEVLVNANDLSYW